MKPTVYLHIGIHKTGSTTIQRFLHANFEKLKNHGVLYSSSLRWVKEGQNEFARFAHHDLAWNFSGPKKAKQSALANKDSFRQDFLNELEKTDYPTSIVVLSSEAFSFVNDEERISKLLEIFEGFPLKVIMYLRMHHRWMESNYRQVAKTGSPLSTAEFLKLHPQLYLNRLQLWERMVGAENLELKVYDVEKKNLLDGFLSILKPTLALTTDFKKQKKQNSSYPSYFVDFIKQVNEANDYKSANELFQLVNHTIENGDWPMPKDSFFTPAQIEQIHKQAMHEIDELCEALPSFASLFDQLRWSLPEALKEHKMAQSNQYPTEVLQLLGRALNKKTK